MGQNALYMTASDLSKVTLFAIEHPEQIPAMLGYAEQFRIANPVYLALTPHVAYALSRSSIDHTVPEEYYSDEELNVLGLDLIEKVDIFVNDMTSVFRDMVPDVRGCQLDIGAIFWYEIKILINSLAVKTYIFLQILKEVDVDAVCCFETDGEPLEPSLFFLDESVWSLVISNACKIKQLRVDTLKKQKDWASVRSKGIIQDLPLKRKIRAILLRYMGGKAENRLRDIYKNCICKFWGIRYLSKDKMTGPCILTLDIGYSMTETMRVLDEKRLGKLYNLSMKLNGDYDLMLFHKYRHLPVERVRRGLENISWSKEEAHEALLTIEQLASYRDLSSVGDIDLRPLMRRRLSYLIDQGVSRCLNICARAISLMEKYKPAVVIGTAMTWSAKVVFSTARYMNIPTVVSRHGASGGYMLMESVAPIIDYHNDLSWADYVFTYGDGDSQYFDRHYPNNHATTVAVGAAVLDDLKKKVSYSDRDKIACKYGLDPTRPIVMYCPTAMDGNMRVVPYRTRSPGWAFQIEMAIADVFRDFPDIQCVFKLHTSSIYCPVSPIVSYLHDEQIANCIVLNASFTSVMSMADMFITDYPSTSFLEMLVTNQPILVCGHLLPFPFGGKWHPSRLEMWIERVKYRDSLQEFTDLLGETLRECDFAPFIGKDKMLHQFGTHLGDGHSAERAANKICEIVGASVTETAVGQQIEQFDGLKGSV
jgi:hypothetical protein